MAAVLDETLGLAAWVAGYPIVSANLNVTYVNMLPLNTEVIVMTKIESVEDKKVLVSGEMKDESGKIYSKATVLCIIKSVEMLGSVDFREYIESRLKQ
jgi:acyl-coenzyme A thioesterase PaaI-like protein